MMWFFIVFLIGFELGSTFQKNIFKNQLSNKDVIINDLKSIIENNNKVTKLDGWVL